PVIRFNGSDDKLKVDYYVTNFSRGDFSVFVVLKVDASSGGGALMCKENGNNNWDSGESLIWMGDGDNNGTGDYPSFVGYSRAYSYTAGGIGTSAFKVINFDWDYNDDNATGTDKWYVNGILQSLTSTTLDADPDDTGTNDLYIGKTLVGDGVAQNYKGDIAEILIYNRTLGESESNLIANYLMEKYALNPPNNATTLTATGSLDQVSLSWTRPVSIEGRVDTVGIWA
ncbi:MAG: LamG domain-containing protein, partial [Planctomycetes bacterium]|nr:LamG domain-containing protein [Planctomycetota bacterium]